MGMLVEVWSTDFLLQKEDFPAALRALKKFAKESPAEIFDVAAVAAQKSLPDALRAALWEGELDEHGDIVGLRYMADKFSHDASDFAPGPFLEMLARFVIYGNVRYSDDYGDGRWYRLRWSRVDWISMGGGRSEASKPRAIFSHDDGPSDVAPGATVSFRVTLAPDSDGPRSLVFSYVESEFGQSYRLSDARARAVVSALELDPSPFDPGETRTIKVTAAESARGPVCIHFQSNPKGPSDLSCSPRFHVPTPEEDAGAWKILRAQGTSSRAQFVPPRFEKRAAELVRRYAVRHAHEPGGALLAPLAQATSLAEALALVGLEITYEKRRQCLQMRATELPGSERHFMGLLRALSNYADFHATGRLDIVFANRPEWHRIYTLRYGGQMEPVWWRAD